MAAIIMFALKIAILIYCESTLPPELFINIFIYLLNHLFQWKEDNITTISIQNKYYTDTESSKTGKQQILARDFFYFHRRLEASYFIARLYEELLTPLLCSQLQIASRKHTLQSDE